MEKNQHIKDLEDSIFQYATDQKNTQQRIYEILICIYSKFYKKYCNSHKNVI